MLAGLRDGGFAGNVTLIGAEAVLPYERPHLSKGYLLGTVPREKLPLRPPDQYAATMLLGESVAEVDVARRTVSLASGRRLAWDVLCLATGSAARRLEGFTDALHLRELPDADRLRGMLQADGELDIVGAGFIGCEVAAVAAQKGIAVRVHETLAQPMLRVLGPELGAYLAQVHRSHGVDMRLGSTSATADLVGAPGAVRTARYARSDLLIAVGSLPRTELAERAGLAVDRGILVDQLGRTPAPGVFAAGDVTRFFHPLYDTHVRVEHFQTSQRQGYAVGRTMAGVETAHDEVPWFWSDQYDLNLQYAGAGLPWDAVLVRGEFGRPPFTVFQLAGEDVVAAIGVDDHHTVARARHLMQRRAKVSRERLADPSFDLRRALP